MSNAKALPAAKPTPAAKPAQPEGEFRRSVRLINRFIAGQRGIFGMAMLMLIFESLTSIAAKIPIAWLLSYLQEVPPSTQPIADDIAETFALLPVGVITAIREFFIGLTQTNVLIFLSVAILVVAVLNSVSDSFSELYLVKGGRSLGFKLRDQLYAHLQKLSLAFYSQQRTGDLLARVTGDVTALEEFAVKSLKDIAGSFFIIGLTLAVLFYSNWQMGLIALVTVPILSIASNYFADRIKTAAKKQRAREGELAAAAQEMLTSIRVIQVYGSAGDQQKGFADTSKKAMDVAIQVGRLQAGFGGVISVLQAVVVVIIVWASVGLVNAGAIELGTTYLFIAWIQDLFKPTKRIIKQWNEVGKIMASAERISEVLDRKPAVEDKPGAVAAPPLTGQIEYRNVSFAYLAESEDATAGQPELRLALRNVNMSISPGEVVALVGGSGAGKSTIVQLLPRLYDPHMGQVMIDGHDIRDWTLDSLRSRMSMVLQEAILFAGTVAENIAYGRPNATREEIIAAALQANAHEFIEKLPEGYDTMLSERASNLSGGQRQRIAIARAFIRNTPILILDEPTTGLDAESTDLVLSALRTLMKGKSTVIISHDLNLIRNADRIVVVKQGEIAQVGTHKELLRSGGVYADLYHKQFGKAVEEVGGQIKPAEAAPAPVEEEDADEDAIPVVAPQVFQTMMTKALPQPVSVQTFQTLMMQALPPAPVAAAPAPAAPVAQAPAVVSPPIAQAPVAQAPVAQAPAVAAPPAEQPKAEELGNTPSFAPSTPAATPETVKPAATAAPQPKPEGPAKPKPIFATTLMHTIPLPDATPAPAPAAPAKPEAASAKPDVKSTILLSADELRAFQAGQAAPAADQPLDEGQLDPQYSPALQQDLPGMATAFDHEAMRGYLQTALFGTSNPRFTIASCSTGEAGFLPDGTCTLRYKLDLHDQQTGATQRQIVGARIFRNQLTSALYLRDKLAPLAALLRGRDEVAMFSNPAALIEPLYMTVYAFPVDGELPALVGATDSDRMAGVLSETLPEALDESFEIDRCEIELVDYARQKRAVLRYLVEGRRPGEQDVEQRTVYGKVFADGNGALAGPITVALRERVAASGHQINIPQCYGWRPDLQLSLLEAIPGEPPISDMLKARLRGMPLPDAALSLEEMVDQCGRIAALLHTSDIKLGRRRSFDDEIAALRQELAPILRYSPVLGARLQGWLEQIETYAEQSDPLPLVFSHGDFTSGQMIFDGATPGLVDFDSVCQAEPALDLGQFLAYLRVADKKKEQTDASGELVAQISERFLEAYLAAAGDRVEDVDRLRIRISVYKIISLLRRTMRSWQKFKGSRTASALAILEEEIACLPHLGY
jgi:ABC-type multidrug transport system fused ATPase/permease subunit